MDEVVDICRVCRCEGTEESPLHRPCLCTGSIGFVHQDCLKTWLEVSKKRSCEVCKHEYRFALIYKDTGEKLSIRDIAQALVAACASTWWRIVRVLCVFGAWGFVLPLTARVMWICLFETLVPFWDREEIVKAFMSDWAQGGLICIVFFSIALGVLGLRDFIVAHNLPIGDPLAVIEGIDDDERPLLDDGDTEEERLLEELEDQLLDNGDLPPPPVMHDNNNFWHEAEGFDPEPLVLQPPAPPAAAAAAPPAAGEAMAEAVAPAAAPPVVDAPLLEDGDDAGLEHLLGLAGPLQNLAVNLFWVTVINTLTIITFAYLPVKIGTIVAFIFGYSDLTPISQGLAGYSLLSVFAVLYLVFLHDSLRQARTAHRLVSFFCAFLKVSILLGIEVVLCPWVLGWWLDICALDYLAHTLQDRVQFFDYAPWTASFLHWLVGMVFMHNFATFVALLREVLRKGVLWFFRDPNDPEFHPLKQMLEMKLPRYFVRLFLIMSLYSVIIALLVWLPAKCALLFAPTLLPYRGAVSFPVELFVINIVVPFLFHFMDVQEGFRALVTGWVRIFSEHLNLTAYMLPPPTPTTEPPYKPPNFGARIALLVVLASATSFCAASFLCIAPVSVGRSMVAATLGVEVHDVFNALLGLAVLLAPFIAHGVMRRMDIAFPSVLMLIYKGCSLVLALLVFFGAMPVLLGTLVDVYLVLPVKVYAGMSPTMSIWNAWAAGIFGFVSSLRLDLAMYARLLRVYERLREHGLAGFSFRAFWQCISVVIVPGLLLLAVPYALTFGMLANTPGVSTTAVYTVYRLIYPSILILAMANVAGFLVYKGILHVYRTAHNNKFLVGERLLDYNDNENAAAPQ